MPHRLVNFEFLRENTFGNNTYVLELIDLFMTTTTPLLEDLKTDCKDEKWDEVRRVAHKLKSNYGILAVKQAEAILNQLEAYDGNPENKVATCTSIDEMIKITAIVYKELSEEVAILKK